MLQHQADIFMHDNALCHRASRVSRFFREENIQALDWPGKSGYQPQRKCMFFLKRKVGQMLPKGQDDLDFISMGECYKTRKLVISMPDRISEVIENRGGPTKY